MKKINISLETFWFGGNYTDKKIRQDGANCVTIFGKKRFTGERFYKSYTLKYAKRILGDSFKFDQY